MKRPESRTASTEDGAPIRQSRFPFSIFWFSFGGCTLSSGVGYGINLAMEDLALDPIVQTHLKLLYWFLVASALTLYIMNRTEKAYEKPLKRISEATRKVAKGDFSVYIPTTHTPDKLDYLDLMILDLNRMIEELGSVETLKTDFFSNVSHEIKTPLAVIQSSVELMEQPGRTQEEYHECARNIQAATRRLSDLISNMLKLNKLEKQTIQPVPERYDLCRQLCDCALQFESRWEEKEIEFDAELEDEAFVEADEGLLELVWNNLLSNAVKFTPPGGTVTLAERREGDCLFVSVTDTGCGMSEETLRHIFDKFYQGDTSHATEGNGLGLALVKRVLELSGGGVSVESREGVGSTFTVTLNAADADAEADAETAAEADTGKEADDTYETGDRSEGLQEL